MDYHYLQRATMLIAPSELAALMLRFDQAAYCGGYQTMAKNAGPDSSKLVFWTMRAFYSHMFYTNVTIIYFSIGIFYYFIGVFFRLFCFKTIFLSR